MCSRAVLGDCADPRFGAAVRGRVSHRSWNRGASQLSHDSSRCARGHRCPAELRQSWGTPQHCMALGGAMIQLWGYTGLRVPLLPALSPWIYLLSGSVFTFKTLGRALASSHPAADPVLARCHGELDSFPFIRLCAAPASTMDQLQSRRMFRETLTWYSQERGPR